MRSKYAELNARLADPTDWLDDFEFELMISFCLGEGDREYDEDDENVLMQIRVDSRHCREVMDDWGFGNTQVDHAQSWAHFEGESRCYLYHEL